MGAQQSAYQQTSHTGYSQLSGGDEQQQQQQPRPTQSQTNSQSHLYPAQQHAVQRGNRSNSPSYYGAPPQQQHSNNSNNNVMFAIPVASQQPPQAPPPHYSSNTFVQMQTANQTQYGQPMPYAQPYGQPQQSQHPSREARADALQNRINTRKSNRSAEQTRIERIQAYKAIDRSKQEQIASHVRPARFTPVHQSIAQSVAQSASASTSAPATATASSAAPATAPLQSAFVGPYSLASDAPTAAAAPAAASSQNSFFDAQFAYLVEKANQMPLTTLTLILRILQNILTAEQQHTQLLASGQTEAAQAHALASEKYRRLKLTNAKIDKDIVQVEGAMELLISCGFEPQRQPVASKPDEQKSEAAFAAADAEETEEMLIFPPDCGCEIGEIAIGQLHKIVATKQQQQAANQR